MPTPVNRYLLLTAVLALGPLAMSAKLMAVPNTGNNSVAFSESTPVAILDGYQLKFEDNFDTLSPAADIYGTGLHPALWITQRPWGPYTRVNNEDQIYIDQHGRHQGHADNPFSLVNDEQGNSLLKITAAALDSKNLPAQPATDNAEWFLYPTNQQNASYNIAGGWNPVIASGLLNTHDSFNFVNGYIEIRAKLPAAEGLVPALRMVSGTTPGATTGIDISTLPEAYADKFHTYAVHWEKERIQWFVDGEVTKVQTGSEVPTQAMHLLINLAIDADRVNAEAFHTQSAEFLVDYVRIYQRSVEKTVIARASDVLYLEAETAILLGSMVAGNDADASAGAFVHVPVGTGTGDACIDFVFNVSEEGLYSIEAGVSGASDEQNSFFTSINGASRVPWTFPVSETFETVQVTSRNGGTTTLQLSEGKNVVRLTRRENGARIDWMSLVPVSPEGDQDLDGFDNAVDAFPLDPEEWTDSDRDGLGNNADPTPYGSAQPLRAEAEVATLSGTMTVQADVLAQGGAYVTSPIGIAATGSDFIQFDFKLPAAGNYRIEGGVLANSGRTDSFFVTVNDGPVLNWAILISDSYATDVVSDQGVGDLVFLLGAGTNTIKVLRRESGARLDWLQLIPAGTALDVDGDGFEGSRDAFPNDPAEWTDSDSDGTGNNADPTPYGDSSPLRAEAELATLRGQMRSFSDSQASNSGYVAVPLDADNSMPRDDVAEFDFKVTTAGRYSLVASVYATNGFDDSFIVSIDGGDFFTWDIPSLSIYTTVTVSDLETGDLVFDLAAGAHRISISRRERGARLDWLELIRSP